MATACLTDGRRGAGRVDDARPLDGGTAPAGRRPPSAANGRRRAGAAATRSWPAPARAPSPGFASGSPPRAHSASRWSCRCRAWARWTRCWPATASRWPASTPVAERCSARAPASNRARSRPSRLAELLVAGHGGGRRRRRPLPRRAGRAARVPADGSPLHVPWARHHAALRQLWADRRPAVRARAGRRALADREGSPMMTAVDVRTLRPGDLDAIERIERSAYPDAVVAIDVRRRAGQAQRHLPGRLPGRGHARLPDRRPLRRRLARDERGGGRALPRPRHRRPAAASSCSSAPATTSSAATRWRCASSNDTAIGLYRRLGFVETGIRRGYYTDNREDALIMWRDPGE